MVWAQDLFLHYDDHVSEAAAVVWRARYFAPYFGSHLTVEINAETGQLLE